MDHRARTVLTRVVRRLYPDDLLVELDTFPTLPARSFFVDLAAVNDPEAHLGLKRGYYGQVDSVRVDSDGSWLVYITGSRIKVAVAVSAVPRQPASTVPGQHLLALGLPKPSRTGHLYIRITDPARIALAKPA